MDLKQKNDFMDFVLLYWYFIINTQISLRSSLYYPEILISTQRSFHIITPIFRLRRIIWTCKLATQYKKICWFMPTHTKSMCPKSTYNMRAVHIMTITTLRPPPFDPHYRHFILPTRASGYICPLRNKQWNAN